MKRRLAYSTMSNLSYVLFGAMLLTADGLTGALMHMVFHAIMKIALFSCVGAVMVKTGRTYVQQLRGLSRRMPVIMAVFAFCAVELVGVPPFVGFQSKWALAMAAISEGGVLPLIGVAVLLISAVLTAVYMLAPVVSAYTPDPAMEPGSDDPGWRMTVPLVLLCAVMLVLAFYSAPLCDYIASVAAGA